MIDRLEMEQFRGIERLVLTDLTRVNVLVGANNVGKTSVLEAVFLLHQLDSVEPSAPMQSQGATHAETAPAAVALVPWAVRQTLRRRGYQAGGEASHWPAMLLRDDGSGYKPALLQGIDGAVRRTLRIHPTGPATAACEPRVWESPPQAVFFDLLATTDEQVSDRVGTLKQRRRKEGLVALLRQLEPRLVDIDQLRVNDSKTPEVWLDLGGPSLQRLTQAGHGLRFAAALFTELEQAKDAVVLVDEVEAGLHHDALRAVWQAMNALSKANDLQLFVTTHSAECLRAAHAAMASEPDDLAVFRLERTAEGELVAFRLGAEEREAAFHYGSEVR